MNLNVKLIITILILSIVLVFVVNTKSVITEPEMKTEIKPEIQYRYQIETINFVFPDSSDKLVEF